MGAGAQSRVLSRGPEFAGSATSRIWTFHNQAGDPAQHFWKGDMEVLKLPLSIGCLLKVLRWVSGTHLPWEKTSKELKAESCFISVCLVMLVSQATYGQAFREYQVKAAFVYNFAQFTEWPTDAFPSTNSPLVIGVFGKNPFDDFLKETVQNETLRGHPVQLKQ